MSALHIRFGALAYDDLMEALTKLRQVSSISSYKAQFEVLSNRIKELSEKHKLSCFLSGLRGEIHLPIKMFNPQNLNLAFGLAKIQEEYLLSNKKTTKPWIDVPKPSILGPPPPIKNEKKDSKTTKLPIQRLPTAQIEGRREFAFIVRKSGMQDINARLQKFSFWKVCQNFILMSN